MASIDGLITGMSTTDTINQLMKLEAAPQTALKNKITTANKVVSAYQSVNSRLSSLVSAAKALGTSDTWGAMKAASTSDAVAVSAKAGASAGSLSFKVDRLATTQVVTFREQNVPGVKAVTDPVLAGTGPFSLDLVDPSDPNSTVLRTLTPADGSLKSVVDAINAATDLPYTASVAQINSGEYTLQLTAKGSGAKAAADMSAAGLPTGLTVGGPSTTTKGDDAVLTVGADETYEVRSATNTFTDVLPGVTVTAAKKQTATDAPVTVSVTADADSIATKVQALIDNANVVLAEIASQSKSKSGEVAAGPLVGDAAMRQLSQDILGALAEGASGLGLNGTTASFKDVGITIGEGGKLAFKRETFLDLHKLDPAKAEKFLNATPTDDDPHNGLARRFEKIGLVATEGFAEPGKPKQKGTLDALIQQRNDAIRGLNDQIAAWDTRLEMRRTTLQRQFSGLEVALGKMQQQSSWLAGQLAGLA